MNSWTWNAGKFWTETESILTLSKKEEKEIHEELAIIPHLRSSFNYEFASSSPGSNFDVDDDEIEVIDTSILTDVVTEAKEELIKNIMGAGFIAVGTMLLNPAGPEDVISLGPIDEAVGLLLIWTGRGLLWL